MTNFKYEHPNVNFFITEDDHYITLQKIIIDNEYRGSGIGTDFMNKLKEYAVSVNKELYLSPSSDFGGRKNKLTNWYKKLQFKNKPKNDFESPNETMVYKGDE
jgi:GNAT superfamily N-acetyltransferase